MSRPALMLEKGEQFFQNGMNLFVNRVSERFDLPEHAHDFIEICYVWAGNGFHYVGNETVRVRQGDLFFLPVGVGHIFRPSSADPAKPLIIGNCLFDEAIFRFLTAVLPVQYGLYRFRRLVGEPGSWLRMREKSGEFGRLFELLLAEFDGKRTGYETMMCGLLLQLLIEMERALDETDAPAAGSQAPAERVGSALRYMREHLHGPLRLADVARHVGIGARQLQRDLAGRTGLSFAALLSQERIDRSRRLLADPSLASVPIADIASKVGLNDPKRFHRLFKEATGTTPARYRRGDGRSRLPPGE